MKNEKPNQETERNQIRNAYSYIRLSSKRQTHGDKSGTDRQMDNFKEVCQRYAWIPQNQTFRDLGVSAFHGANLRGDLGNFMELARQGSLAEYPVLVLESLDRFSRQDIDESEPAVMDLLKVGVSIHVKFTAQTFTRGSTIELGDRIQILVALKAAHNYSMQLSERVTAAKNRKLVRLDNGEAVNIRDYAPGWIAWNKEAKTLGLNNNAEAVRIIFREYQSGKSLAAVCRFLHDNHINSFRGGNWTKQTVRNILNNPATYGEFKGKANVFPKVIEKEQFDAVELVIFRNAGVKLHKGEKAADGQTFGRRGRTSTVVNIFRGLVRCSGCGQAMSMHTGRTHVYYRCDTAVNNACDNHLSARMDSIEESIIGGLIQLSPVELLASHDKTIAYEISQLNLKRDSITKKIDALLELAGILGTDEIKPKMLPLKTERDNLDTDISKLQRQASIGSKSPEALSIVQKLMRGELGIPGIDDSVTVDETIDKAIELIQTQLANEETRKQLANVMPNIVKEVRINGNYDFEVHYVAGGTEKDIIA